jgi:hypothetical protein
MEKCENNGGAYIPPFISPKDQEKYEYIEYARLAELRKCHNWLKAKGYRFVSDPNDEGSDRAVELRCRSMIARASVRFSGIVSMRFIDNNGIQGVQIIDEDMTPYMIFADFMIGQQLGKDKSNGTTRLEEFTIYTKQSRQPTQGRKIRHKFTDDPQKGTYGNHSIELDKSSPIPRSEKIGRVEGGLWMVARPLEGPPEEFNKNIETNVNDLAVEVNTTLTSNEIKAPTDQITATQINILMGHGNQILGFPSLFETFSVVDVQNSHKQLEENKKPLEIQYDKDTNTLTLVLKNENDTREIHFPNNANSLWGLLCSLGCAKLEYFSTKGSTQKNDYLSDIQNGINKFNTWLNHNADTIFKNLETEKNKQFLKKLTKLNNFQNLEGAVLDEKQLDNIKQLLLDKNHNITIEYDQGGNQLQIKNGNQVLAVIPEEKIVGIAKNFPKGLINNHLLTFNINTESTQYEIKDINTFHCFPANNFRSVLYKQIKAQKIITDPSITENQIALPEKLKLINGKITGTYQEKEFAVPIDYLNPELKQFNLEQDIILDNEHYEITSRLLQTINLKYIQKLLEKNNIEETALPINIDDVSITKDNLGEYIISNRDGAVNKKGQPVEFYVQISKKELCETVMTDNIIEILSTEETHKGILASLCREPADKENLHNREWKTLSSREIKEKIELCGITVSKAQHLPAGFMIKLADQGGTTTLTRNSFSQDVQPVVLEFVTGETAYAIIFQDKNNSKNHHS